MESRWHIPFLGDELLDGGARYGMDKPFKEDYTENIAGFYDRKVKFSGKRKESYEKHRRIYRQRP